MELPDNIVPAEIKGQTFNYTCCIQMLDDIKRLRKQLGWEVKRSSSKEGLLLKAISGKTWVKFFISSKTLYVTLWPSLYPNNTEVLWLRNMIFYERFGVDKVVNKLNETPHVPQSSEGPSCLDLILDSDD